MARSNTTHPEARRSIVGHVSDNKMLTPLHYDSMRILAKGSSFTTLDLIGNRQKTELYMKKRKKVFIFLNHVKVYIYDFKPMGSCSNPDLSTISILEYDGSRG